MNNNHIGSTFLSDLKSVPLPVYDKILTDGSQGLHKNRVDDQGTNSG